MFLVLELCAAAAVLSHRVPIYRVGTRSKGEVYTGTNHLGFRCVKVNAVSVTTFADCAGGYCFHHAVASDSRLVRPMRSSARVHDRIAAQVAAAVLASVLLIAATSKALADDPLPSWNNTAPKKAIVAFVEKVTKEGSP
jgi:hypothetical protein